MLINRSYVDRERANMFTRLLKPEYAYEVDPYWETEIIDKEMGIFARGYGQSKEEADENAVKEYKYQMVLKAEERLREYNHSIGYYADLP